MEHVQRVIVVKLNNNFFFFKLTLTLKITTAQVFETSVTVNNSPIKDYVHPDNLTQPTYEMSPGARSSKVSIINGPGTLSPFTFKIGVLIVLHLT